MIILQQGQMWKSSDDLYVYNIFSYSTDSPIMILDILDKELHWISTKYDYSVASFISQIEQNNIILYTDQDIKDEQKK